MRTLAAQSAQGIYVEEANGLTVDTVGPVAANRVNADGSVTVVNDAALSDVRTLNSGPVKLVTTTGSLVLNPGSNANGLGDRSGR